MSLQLIILLGLVLIGLFVWLLRKRRASVEELRGWRVRRVGVGEVVYEEKKEDGWDQLQFLEKGEDPLRQGWHEIDFPPAERWFPIPHWAAGRRTEIIGRIKAELPGYIYEETA